MLATITKIGSQLLDGIQLWARPFFITFGSTSYKMRGDEMRHLINQVQPGDLLFRRYDRYVTAKFIPGFFGHVGIATEKTKVVHALRSGVVEEDILQYLRTDHVRILRPVIQGDIKKAIDRAVEQKGKPYDFEFDTSNKKALYCTELIMHCYSEIVPDTIERKNRVAPDRLLDIDGFRQVHDSREWREK